jgi:ribosomal protein S18 acetylase RimI-like enzyme
MSLLAGEITFDPCGADDFETMLAIRLAAMRESLERLGRFDVARSRARLERSFYPQWSEFICWKGERVGFFTFRRATDGFHLEHLYVLPGCQSQGIGSFVLARLTAQADAAGLAIFLGALKESAANRFYSRHGFTKDNESEWDVYYVRQPARAA